MNFSAYEFSTLREGQFTLQRGLGDRLEPILVVACADEYPSRGSLQRLVRIRSQDRPQLRRGRFGPVGVGLGGKGRLPVGARGPRRRTAGANAWSSDGRGPIPAGFDPACLSNWADARARLDPRGRQAGQHPFGHRNRRPASDRFRHCVQLPRERQVRDRPRRSRGRSPTWR